MQQTRWPHREQQVQQLQLLLNLPQPPDVLVYGPSCTAKTSIVRHVVAGRPHAYVSCCRSLKLRSLLSSVVGQLAQGGKRKRAQAFAGAAGTEHSLLWELKAACPADQPCKVLVLDEMQQLLAASEGPLGALLAMREQAGINMCLVMVSRQQPAAQGLLGLMPSVVPLACPAYSDSQLVDILAAAGPPQTPASIAAAATAGFSAQEQPAEQHNQQQQREEELQAVYRRFLSNTLVSQFHRLSRSLPDIQCQAAALWPKYLSGAAAAAGSSDGGSNKQQQKQRQQAEGDDEGDADVDRESRMYSAVAGRLQSALGGFQPATCCTLATTATAAAAAGAGTGGGAGSSKVAVQKLGMSGAHVAAGLELCRLSKLLLVSAFLASRNKPSVDKQLFTQGMVGWRGRGGGRRRNVMNADRQAEAAKAAELRGPHTFSLSRLMTIYTSLLAADENHSNIGSTGSRGGSSIGSRGSGSRRSWQQQQQQGDQSEVLMASAGWMGVNRSDVLMGVNTLVASRLMSQACDDILEAPRFSCEAPHDLIEQLAMDLSIPLTNYLKYV